MYFLVCTKQTEPVKTGQCQTSWTTPPSPAIQRGKVGRVEHFKYFTQCCFGNSTPKLENFQHWRRAVSVGGIITLLMPPSGHGELSPARKLPHSLGAAAPDRPGSDHCPGPILH
eukprot:768268-Hanusia_phi.AAC.2